MTIYFSQTAMGFFDSMIHPSDCIPAGAVEISAERHKELLSGQSDGKIISCNDDGNPVLVDPPSPSHDDAIKAQIIDLEATATPRRIREAALGTDGGWLARLDEQIAALRAQLT